MACSRITMPVVVFTLMSALGLQTIARGQVEAAKPYGEGAGALRPAAPVETPGIKVKTLYRFTGVTDDGEQGSGNRKEATSVICTNIDSKKNAQVEVQVFQWNGADMWNGTVNIPPNRTFTYSTQNTTIYFDDVILGGSAGTDAIFQGSGLVLSSHKNVICTAQALDPLNYPPEFVTSLDIVRTTSAPRK